MLFSPLNTTYNLISKSFYVFVFKKLISHILFHPRYYCTNKSRPNRYCSLFRWLQHLENGKVFTCSWWASQPQMNKKKQIHLYRKTNSVIISCFTDLNAFALIRMTVTFPSIITWYYILLLEYRSGSLLTICIFTTGAFNENQQYHLLQRLAQFSI